MLNKPGASAIITTAKPRVLWIAKMFGDDDFFCFLLSFPKVVVGNPLLSIRLTLFVITTDPRQKHSGMTLAFAFCLSSFPNVIVQDLLFVVAVILESRSPGSVVIKQGKIVPLFGLYTQNDRLIYPRTLRAGSWWGACSPLG